MLCSRSPQELGGNRHDQRGDEQKKYLGERALPLALISVTARSLVRLHSSGCVRAERLLTSHPSPVYDAALGVVTADPTDSHNKRQCQHVTYDARKKYRIDHWGPFQHTDTPIQQPSL